MLKITDSGCNEHQWRQFAFSSEEADFVIDLLYNLSREGDFHTYICEHGQTHTVSFQMQPASMAAVGQLACSPAVGLEARQTY